MIVLDVLNFAMVFFFLIDVDFMEIYSGCQYILFTFLICLSIYQQRKITEKHSRLFPHEKYGIVYAAFIAFQTILQLVFALMLYLIRNSYRELTKAYDEG